MYRRVKQQTNQNQWAAQLSRQPAIRSKENFELNASPASNSLDFFVSFLSRKRDHQKLAP